MTAIAEVWPLRRKARVPRTPWWKNLLRQQNARSSRTERRATSTGRSLRRHGESRRLVDAGLEVDDLDCRARGALAEIVERGHRQDLLLGLVAIDGELHGVGVDQPVGAQKAVPLQPLAVGQRPHRDEGLAVI